MEATFVMVTKRVLVRPRRKVPQSGIVVQREYKCIQIVITHVHVARLWGVYDNCETLIICQ